MSENLSLHSISILILVLLTGIAAAVVMGAYRLNGDVQLINSAWSSFKSQHAEKARLETKLRATLGYGGMIHDFKNYLLRKDLAHFVKLQQSLGAAQSVVAQYKSFGSTQAEKLVLEDLQDMLSQYQQGLEQARIAIANGTNSKEIDLMVRIDDSFALRALKVLHEEIISEYEYYRNVKQKPVVANAIRADLGYGGMIHAFKNFVLRGEDKYLVLAKESIASLRVEIKRYRQLDHTLGERTALEDIGNTVAVYESKLEIARELIASGASAEEIDNEIVVDDTHALRGLKTLDQDIILQIENKSGQLSLQLEDISVKELQITQALGLTILILATFLYFIFSRTIKKPVLELSKVMAEIAEGNTEVDYYYSDQAKTELGEIARSLKIFKENEKRRKEAEEEILRLAMTDPLTGLANRNKFEVRYKEIVSLSKREEKIIALFALDLDRFKPINDEHGHAAGDEVLRHVAENLSLAFRDTDLVARTGGDEFLILLYGPESVEMVIKVARRLLTMLQTPIPFDDKMLSIGACIGIALRLPHVHESMEQLILRADTALYQAKNEGRNTFRLDENEEDYDKVAIIYETASERA